MIKKIRITIKEHRLAPKYATSEYSRMFAKLFRIVLPSRGSGDVEIILTQEEFVKFLLYRNDQGMPNWFQELNPKYFDEMEQPLRIFSNGGY